jgi:hypothetical protein
VDLIVEAEVSSEAYYSKFLQSPIVPGGASGVTIGIGYDLGHNSKEQITNDWKGQIPDADLNVLLSCAGIKGVPAKTMLSKNPQLRRIKVPIGPAKAVFYKASLPHYAKLTAKAYPGLDKLMPDAIGALVSMVYNRGDSLTGKNREEMAAIVPLVAKADYVGIANQVEKSKRIWAGKPALKGVYLRREKEAAYIRTAIREYDPAGLITVDV